MPTGNWTRTLHNWLNVFLEASCPLCQRSAKEVFCLDCQRQIQRCQVLQPEQFWQGDPPVFAWGSYGGALKRSLATLKYDRQPQLAQPLGHWLARAWLNSSVAIAVKHNTPLTVVPIPIHTSKRQQRGYNQAELLAQSFCELTRLPLQSHGLARIRATEAQFGLSTVEREQNLASAFCVGSGLQKHFSGAVLLLDDIYTTGATARAATQTLRQQGISVYGLVAIAISQKAR